MGVPVRRGRRLTARAKKHSVIKTGGIRLQWIHDFIRKNPQTIVTGWVPVSQIVEELKKDCHAEDMPLDAFAPYKVQMQRDNAYFYAQDEQLSLQMEDIEIKIVRIPVTDQTRRYTEKDFTRWVVHDAEDRNGIYIAYEEKSNYFYCNSSMLHLELSIARGISASDVSNKTEKYREYAGLMQRYIENYMDLNT